MAGVGSVDSLRPVVQHGRLSAARYIQVLRHPRQYLAHDVMETALAGLQLHALIRRACGAHVPIGAVL